MDIADTAPEISFALNSLTVITSLKYMTYSIIFEIVIHCISSGNLLDESGQLGKRNSQKQMEMI
ncbi:hypothetical protein CLOHYLEM_04095 [[Clostridium] hylemonae DSM 15053]|uniref:Uncharacterized protein n=1 Tax=[Clostridium] hylemonae DSM 15053 TaxID=553973 RepID=C0BWB2_9FIRM|nr:hypothetical protein CLOHYLEM_04095 [[Clostridium] hylemonae DSM 15053]